MDYPLPIDAAGRTVLVILCLSFLRHEGVFWLISLLTLRIQPFAWLDECARFGPLRLAEHCAIVIVRAGVGLFLLTLILLWTLYALIRLGDDLATAPALAILGSSMAIASCWAMCHRRPAVDVSLTRLTAPSGDLHPPSGPGGNGRTHRRFSGTASIGQSREHA
jgi:hypothetical protein